MRIALVASSLLLVCACRADVKAAPVQVIVFGDSISLSISNGGPEGWPDKLEEMLEEQGRDWTVVNRSINGNGLVWRTRCFGDPALVRLRSALPGIAKDRPIILMAGVNDMIQPTLPASFSDCFDPVDFPASAVTGPLQALRQSAGDRRILLATIPPFAASEYYSAEAEARRSAINRWIVANWPREDVIDLANLLASREDRSRLNPDFDSGDGLHPNDKGNQAIAAAVKERIE